MDKIITGTGKKFETDSVSYSPLTKTLYVRLYNTDYPTVATVFSNPEETGKLTYGDIIYEGFTRLGGIIHEEDLDCLRVNMEATK